MAGLRGIAPAYAVRWVGLFAVGAAAARLGLHPVGMALFPIPIALHWVRRCRGQSLGLLACAILAGGAGYRKPEDALYYGLVAATGLWAGVGFERRWSYGWIVTGAVAVVYAVVLGDLLAHWDTWKVGLQNELDRWIALWSAKQEAGSEGAQEAWRQQIAWLREHWVDVGLGVQLWPILTAVCIGVSWTARQLRRWPDGPAPRGSFREMRTSEWLVWLAIAVAGLWFANQYWPHAVLRVTSWNAAVALAAVYWFNGFSAMLFACSAIRFSPAATGAAVVLVLFFGGSVVSFVGLFDTWFNFRQKVAGLAARRRERDGADHRSNGDEL